MSNVRTGHVVLCAVAVLIFAIAAIDARSFEGTSRLFPQFAAITGMSIAGVSCALGSLKLYRMRKTRGALSPADPDRRTLLAGFFWLAVWAGFILCAIVVGYLAASTIWLMVWFRTVHAWRFRVLVPVVALTVLCLWSAQELADVSLPGGDGLLTEMLLAQWGA